MTRSQPFVVTVARSSLVAMTAFTLAVAVQVLGGDLPPGHPPVEAQECVPLPPGHPPVEGAWMTDLPPGHPPVRVERLPPGHPPIDEARPIVPVLGQDGTSTI
jgi:hypothetical protein